MTAPDQPPRAAIGAPAGSGKTALMEQLCKHLRLDAIVAFLRAKDKGAIPAGVYEKARADGIVLEKLGPDTLWLKLRPLWAEDQGSELGLIAVYESRKD